MVRPTFLVAEPRPQEGISARKLVLETALYNVITAYDAPGALQLLERFPKVDAVIVHTGLGDSYKEVLEKSVAGNPDRMTVLLSPNGSHAEPHAKVELSSHNPKELLDLLLDNFRLPEDE